MPLIEAAIGGARLSSLIGRSVIHQRHPKFVALRAEPSAEESSVKLELRGRLEYQTHLIRPLESATPVVGDFRS